MNSIPILYDNKEIYVINKPAGLAVQGGQGISHSLDEEFARQVGQKVFLVHRLDKDTSGLMVIAKDPKSAGKWTKLIGSKVVQKEYVAICAGTLQKKSGIIMDDVIQHGEQKSAVTKYQVEKEWDLDIPADEEKGTPATVIHMTQVRLKLETGRMHQIRIHLAKQGCPIAGDDQHGNFKVNKLLKKYHKIKTLQLCSQKLIIPIENENKIFEVSYGITDLMK